jgi:hypothetical protein
MGLAPPFRDLTKRYPVDNLAEALAEGIVTGHPAMPHFTFEPREIDALLRYISSLGSLDERAPHRSAHARFVAARSGEFRAAVVPLPDPAIRH